MESRRLGLSFADLPAHTTCTPSSALVILDGTHPSSITMTVATTARNATSIGSLRPVGGLVWSTTLCLFAGVILSQRVRGRVAGPTIVLLLLMSLSCGGSGNNVASDGGGGAGGTPSGTFTLTFKATSGSLIRSTTVSLAIN